MLHKLLKGRFNYLHYQPVADEGPQLQIEIKQLLADMCPQRDNKSYSLILTIPVH